MEFRRNLYRVAVSPCNIGFTLRVSLLSEDNYQVGVNEMITLEIRPTATTGVILSAFNDRPGGKDYLALEMVDGSVTTPLLSFPVVVLGKYICSILPARRESDAFQPVGGDNDFFPRKDIFA